MRKHLPRFLEAGSGCHAPGSDHWTQQGKTCEFASDDG